MRVHLHQQPTGLLSHPIPGRVRGDSGQPYPAPVEFDDEQEVEPGQADRLDGVRGVTHYLHPSRLAVTVTQSTQYAGGTGIFAGASGTGTGRVDGSARPGPTQPGGQLLHGLAAQA